jgi:hypothetical protein
LAAMPRPIMPSPMNPIFMLRLLLLLNSSNRSRGCMPGDDVGDARLADTSFSFRA